MSQINSNNFFRWYTGSTVADTINFPRLGLQDAKIYLPQLVSGETVGFYLNADVPFFDADDFTQLELQINDVNGNTTVVGGGPGTLIKVPLSSGYRLYASFALPNLILGQYNFSIYNLSNSTIKCISNYFQVISQSDAFQYTSVQWRNSRDAYFYDWSLVPDFTCQLRLALSLNAFMPEETIDQTKAVSTGRRRNNNYDTDLAYKLNTYYFDDGANLACIPLFKADTLILNGKNYIQKTAYVPNIRPASAVSIGEIELYDQFFSTINKFGQLPAPVINNTSLANCYTILNNSADNLLVQLGVQGGGVTNLQTMAPGSIYQVPITALDATKYVTLTYSDTDPATVIAAILVQSNSTVYSRTTVNASTNTPFGNVQYSDLLTSNYFMVFGTINAVRSTAWRGLATSKTCVTSGGVNTGYSTFTTLEQYYTDTNTATGVTKTNVNTDPDYIAPVSDPANCSTSSYQSVTLKTGTSTNVCASTSTVTAYAGVHATLYTIGMNLYTNSALTTPLPSGFYVDSDFKLTVTNGVVTNILFCSSSPH